MKLTGLDMMLLLEFAERGTIDATDSPIYRRLWYRGLTKWVSPIHMALSDLGATEVNRFLLQAQQSKVDIPFTAGQRVGVMCDRYGRPSLEANQTLQGQILMVTLNQGRPRYSVYVDQPNGDWIVTAVEDETLLFPLHH